MTNEQLTNTHAAALHLLNDFRTQEESGIPEFARDVLQLIREYQSLVADSETLTEYVAANAPEITAPPLRLIPGGMSKP